MRLLSSVAWAALVAGCSLPAPSDPTGDVFTGEEARSRIVQLAQGLPGGAGRLPESARNFWIYDGGTFNGSITYWSFDCGSREDCWAAIAALGGPGRPEFQPWSASRYAVVMAGPGFYSERLRGAPWDVRTIEHGAVYEQVEGDHRSMLHYAIDLERNRVYHHHESGGFPPDAYQPEAAGR